MRRLAKLGLWLVPLGLSWLGTDYYRYRSAAVINSETAVYQIRKGDGLQEIATRLCDSKIIDKPLWFAALAVERGAAKNLKYGEYEIPSKLSIQELLDLFVSGRQRQYSVTFIEGWRFAQLFEALEAHPAVGHSLASDAPADVMSALQASGESPEGRFFPDTYFFEKGTADVDILKRAYRKMQVVVDAEWRDKADNLALRTPYEALTLASIVEKETAQAEERPEIAGVFMRRLVKGMLLQTDPTVIYGLGQSFSGDLTREHLALDTPYNTYLHLGLPPTPIAMPSISSIHATLHPADGDSLYFVAKGDGYHQFSTSLPSHNKAVGRFQKSH